MSRMLISGSTTKLPNGMRDYVKRAIARIAQLNDKGEEWTVVTLDQEGVCRFVVEYCCSIGVPFITFGHVDPPSSWHVQKNKLAGLDEWGTNNIIEGDDSAVYQAIMDEGIEKALLVWDGYSKNTKGLGLYLREWSSQDEHPLKVYLVDWKQHVPENILKSHIRAKGMHQESAAYSDNE